MIVETQMRQAMLRTLMKADRRVKEVALKIADTADRGVGKHKVREWNAKLSMRTFTNLQRNGVMK
jgi:hypothetical protein